MSSDSSTKTRASASTCEQPCPADAPAYAPSVPSSEQATTTRLSSQRLLGAASEIEIEHDGANHRLRRTALGKLILTK